MRLASLKRAGRDPGFDSPIMDSRRRSGGFAARSPAGDLFLRCLPGAPPTSLEARCWPPQANVCRRSATFALGASVGQTDITFEISKLLSVPDHRSELRARVGR